MRPIVIAAIAAAALATAGCSTTTPQPTETSASAQPVVASSPTSSPTPTAPLFKAFGQRWTYGDDPGIGVIAVPKGAAMTPADAAPPGVSVYVFDLQIVNGTTAAFDPSMSDITVTYGAGGVQAQRVADPANGWDNLFTGTILPTQTQTVTEAYAIPAADLGTVTMSFTPDVTKYAKVVWSGPLP